MREAPQVIEYHSDTKSQVPPELALTVSALSQLPPNAQEIACNLIRDLARQHGINVPHTLASGLQTPQDGLPLWQAYLVGENYAQRTVQSYQYYVKRFLAKDPLPTALSIRQYLANEMRRGVSPSAVHDQIKAFKNFFRYLYDSGLWFVDPMQKIKSPKIPKHEREIPLSEDVFKLLATAKNPKLLAWLFLLTDTGGRYSEIARLEWTQIDLEGRQILLHGKGAKDRVVFISRTTLALLIEYRKSLNGNVMVFPSKDKRGAWDACAANRAIARLCRKAGVKKITNHQFRHYLASYLVEQGGEGALVGVQRLLGHENIETTSRYLHTTREKMRKLHEEHSPLATATKLLQEGTCRK